jgi:hypothetical protein
VTDLSSLMHAQLLPAQSHYFHACFAADFCVAAGMKHPNAEGVDKLAWCTVDQVRSGTWVYDNRRSRKSSASSSSKDPAAAAADVDEEEGEEDVASELASLQLQESSSASTQQQQQPLEVRVPLYRNISHIRNLLDKLARGQAPAPGLQVVQQQQQQQEGGQQLSAPAVQLIQIPAKWAAYALGSSSSSSMLAADAGAGSEDSNNGSSCGGQGFLSTGDSDSRVSGAFEQQQPASAGATDSSSGQQPWAIAVWSGQHARQQQQQGTQ